MSIEQQRSKGIITITKGGYELGKLLKRLYPDAVLYGNKKYVKNDDIPINDGIANLTTEIFNEYSHLIYVMATGIVVRAIVPLLKDKTIDPGVLVIDEKGSNVISLISGHIGGANELAMDISDRISANPVITTASDNNNTLSIDTFAESLNLAMESREKAKVITANILEGQSYCILMDDDFDFNVNIPDIRVCSKISETDEFDNIIAISRDIKNVSKPIIHLRPKSLTIGIGCRKGKPWTDIYSAVLQALSRVDRNIFDIKRLATVDVKKDEEGIIILARKLKVDLDIVSRSDIKEIEDRFETSDFVRDNIGVGAVAEPVACISSKSEKIILNKTRYEGITIAIVEE